MPKSYVKRGGGISPHDVMRERLLSRGQPQAMPEGMPPMPGAPTEGFPANPPMLPPGELPKLLPETIGPRSLMAPGGGSPTGGGLGGAMRGAGAAGAAALPWILMSLMDNEPKMATSADEFSQIPAIDDTLGDSVADTSVGGEDGFAKTARKALGTFKKKGQTMVPVAVPTPKQKSATSTEVSPDTGGGSDADFEKRVQQRFDEGTRARGGSATDKFLKRLEDLKNRGR